MINVCKNIRDIESRPYGRLALDEHFLRSPNPDVYFLFVEKVGCTFIKHVLIEASLGSLDQIDPSYFHTGWSLHNLVHAVAHEVLRVDGRLVLDNPDAKVITFCRNPYSRFVSAYKDKIDNTPDMEATYFKWIRREIFFYKARFNLSQQIVGKLGSRISLRDFATFVRRNPDIEHDRHWAPQHRLMLDGFLDHAHVLRLEHLDQTLPTIWQDLVGTEMPRPTKHATNPGSKTYPMLDQETADIIYEIYQTDFEVLGYDRESWVNF